MNNFYKFEGFEKVDYISKKTGKPVNGYNVYLSAPVSEKRGKGRKMFAQYVTAKIAEDIKEENIGRNICFAYNRFGYVSALIVK